MQAKLHMDSTLFSVKQKSHMFSDQFLQVYANTTQTSAHNRADKTLVHASSVCTVSRLVSTLHFLNRVSQTDSDWSEGLGLRLAVGDLSSSNSTLKLTLSLCSQLRRECLAIARQVHFPTRTLQNEDSLSSQLTQLSTESLSALPTG